MPIPANTDPSQSPVVGFESIYLPVQPYLNELNTFLSGQVNDFEPGIRELVKYTLENSGKRIRPILLYYSAWTDGEALGADIIKAAAVLELVHLATLVHDDILDDASVRHKQQTISQRYGPAVAVLFGDALFAHSLKLAAEFPTAEICRNVSLATRRVCAGEIEQTLQKGTTDLELNQYFRIIELKTAELFWLACRLGSLLSDHPQDLGKALETYARHLGIAYQIFDDVADLFGAEAKIGKTLGTDLANGKYTLPLLLLFKQLDGEQKMSVVQRLKEGDPAIHQDLLLMLESGNILQEVLNIFFQHISEAEAVLLPHEDRSGVTKLLQINTFVSQQMDKLMAPFQVGT